MGEYSTRMGWSVVIECLKQWEGLMSKLGLTHLLWGGKYGHF